MAAVFVGVFDVQVVTVNCISELYRYVDQKQLTADFHGSLKFNHRDWIQQQLVSTLANFSRSLFGASKIVC